MKLFKTFRLDTTNHLLWRGGDRVPIAPKGFDVLAYLVQHAGQVVTQDDILEALWPETYVNPEVLRKYILEIRKALGDRPDNPEFIETVPKRGYRFVAPVTDESATEPPDMPTSHLTEQQGTEQNRTMDPQRRLQNRKVLLVNTGSGPLRSYLCRLWSCSQPPWSATTWSGRRGTASQ
jgi:DNA-binding winged helix-turn-helix (wHTH) protein